MQNKIVALNSGGLDSVVMLHDLRDKNKDSEIYTLFINYGQRAYTEELLCATKVCEKLNLHLKIIDVPKMDWSQSGLLQESEDVYLEMRNMIFLSYAVSYAESLEASSIYVAFIEPLGDWVDVKFEFVENMNKVIEELGIKIIAPLHSLSKEELIPYIRKYFIGRDEFFSCMKTESITGEKCGNCQVIDNMFETIIDPTRVDDLFLAKRFKEFKVELDSMELKKAQIVINDRCNLSCSYCLTNGTDFKELSKEEYQVILDKLHELGITHIDFFGKEPLFNELIFELVDYCEEKGYNYKYSFITNGMNLEKYYEDIVSRNFDHFAISYEGNAEETGRKFIPRIETMIKYIKMGKRVNVSIDLHKHNMDNIINYYVPMFSTIGISEIYIKPIIPIGESIDLINNSFLMNNLEFESFVNRLGSSLTETNSNVIIGIPLHYNKVARKMLNKIDLETNTYRGLHLDHDLFCTSGRQSMYVDSEGFVYGCGMIAYGQCKTHQKPLNILSDPMGDIKKNVRGGLI